MKTIHVQYFKTRMGELVLGSFQGNLCLCDWRHRKNRAAMDGRIQKALHAEFSEQYDQINDLARIQLEEYFHGRRKSFALPLLMTGTTFQKKVWEELMKIPYGKTATYTQLSERLQNPPGIRAVAAANGANALSIIIPCHRIIGANGEMVGYAGGILLKKKLLQLEGSYKASQLELFP